MKTAQHQERLGQVVLLNTAQYQLSFFTERAWQERQPKVFTEQRQACKKECQAV